MPPFTTFNEQFETVRDCTRANLAKLAKSRNLRLTAEHFEEMAQSIYATMLKSGTVERYDPDYGKGTSLTSYIYGQTRFLAMNELGAFQELHINEVTSEHSGMLFDRQEDPHNAQPPDPYVELALQHCMSQLATQYPPTKSRDFSWLFKSLVEQAEQMGEANLATLAKQRNISREAIRLQVNALRELPPVQHFYQVLTGGIAIA